MITLILTDSTSSAGLIKNSISCDKDFALRPLKTWNELKAKVGKDTLVILDIENAAFIQGNVQTLTAEMGATVIAIGSRKSRERLSGAVDEGAAGFIYKPIVVETFKNELKKILSPKGKSIDVNLINPFITATQNALETMTMMKIVKKDLFLKDDYRMFGDISGVMGLSGDAEGSVVISLPQALALKIFAKMVGEEEKTAIDDDVKDAVGEVINVISGQAKGALANTKYHFIISLPSVVIGTGHEISHRSGTPCIAVTFECAGEVFAIQVSLSPK